MILLIDNYDSFTYNLYQQIANLGEAVIVKKNDEITISEIKKLKPKKIVISPGPKKPQDSGVSIKAIKEFYKSTPILGVCLGHEAIGEIFGAKVVHAKKIFHGKISKIRHSGENLFKGVKQNLAVGRYHSLALNAVPEGFTLDAWTNDDEIMAISNQRYPLFGVQFHPESFLTESGDKIIKNFLEK